MLTSAAKPPRTPAERTLSALLFSIVLVFTALSFAGGRGFVGVLSGTLPATVPQALLGVGYVLTWFAAVLVAPVLAFILAALRLPAATRAYAPFKNPTTAFTKASGDSR